MKYEANTKTERNQAVVLMHKWQPELSLEEIGKKFGISKQRVHRIIKKANSKK
jgi:DNA-directed RNA polymerase specialized sigma subunit